MSCPASAASCSSSYFAQKEETFPYLCWIVVATKTGGNHGKHYPYESWHYGYIVKTFLQSRDRNFRRKGDSDELFVRRRPAAWLRGERH
ncbi:exported hypothetical protein [Cupriavidus taiwanensis]|nr:exported hypothetical protein [Cupriavidus taiwanensis]